MKKLREKDFLDFIGLQESQYLEKASIWLDELLDYDNQQQDGDVLPWEQSHDIIHFRRGEVSLWGGINGHGKSLILSQAILYWLQSSKCVIASLEMKPVDTLMRMVKQTGLALDPTDQFKTSFAHWTDDRLWIYDQLDQVPFQRIIGMIHYSAQELGCKHVVIDSLMKCGIDDDNYNEQKKFVDQLCWAAKNENIHIHLVAHMRKKSNETERPNKFDVLGSSAITNLVDNVLIMYRNKSKEAKIEMGEEVGEFESDATLEVRKNRHGGTEGGIKLYFNPNFNQFNQNPNYSMRVDIPK